MLSHVVIKMNQMDQCPSNVRGHVLESNSGKENTLQPKLYLTYPQTNGCQQMGSQIIDY